MEYTTGTSATFVSSSLKFTDSHIVGIKNRLGIASLILGVFSAIILLFSQCSRCSRIDPPTAATEQFFNLSFVSPHDGITASEHDLIPDSISTTDVSITKLSGQNVAYSSHLDARGIHVLGPIFFSENNDEIGLNIQRLYIVDTPISEPDTITIQYRVVENSCEHKYLVSLKVMVGGTQWFAQANGETGYITTNGEQTTITIVVD